MIDLADTSTNQSDMDTQLVHHSGGSIFCTLSSATAEALMVCLHVEKAVTFRWARIEIRPIGCRAIAYLDTLPVS